MVSEEKLTVEGRRLLLVLGVGGGPGGGVQPTSFPSPGCALCLGRTGCGPSGGLCRGSPTPSLEGDFVASGPGLRSSSPWPRHPRLKAAVTPWTGMWVLGIVTSAAPPTERWSSCLTSACKLSRTAAWSGGPSRGGWEVEEHSGLLRHVGQEGGTEEDMSGKGETVANVGRL